MIAGRPSVLIADDDPVTLRFLTDAAARCGCEVLAAAGADAALRILPAPPSSVDLLLLDRRMPGRDGIALLRELRAAGVAAPAVATSAELDPDTIRSLQEAGFAATLSKPAPLAHVRALLARFVRVAEREITTAPMGEPAGSPLLDDGVALAAVGGDRDALAALRRLFAAELAKIAERPFSAPVGMQAARAGDSLHRLRASCAICGALPLRDAAGRLESVLRQQPTRAGDAAQDFARVCAATLEALASITPA